MAKDTLIPSLNRTVEPKQHLEGWMLQSLQDIIGGDWFPVGQTKGYRLVIKGLPGTGKTTLGLHILHHHLQREGPLVDGADSSGLIVYFHELPKELDRIASRFGLDFGSHPPDTADLCEEGWRDDFSFIRSWAQKRDPNARLCILIDGLTVLKVSDPSNIHRFLISLLTRVARHNILLIILAEEELLSIDNSFDYMADAVITLTRDTGAQRHRFLEIEKMRYLDHVRGRHGLELYCCAENSDSTLQIYPRISCRERDSHKYQTVSCPIHESCESGIQGLDEIIMGTRATACFQESDLVIVTAEPGTDKLGMALSFLSPLFNGSSSFSGSAKPARAVWLSFSEGDIYRSLSRTPYNQRFPSIIQHFEMPPSEIGNVDFRCVSRSNPAIHPDRIAFALSKILSSESCQPARVVIDGLSALGSEFANPAEPINYLVWVSRIIRSSKAIGMVFFDLPAAFTRLGNLRMEWSELADFTGHLRWYEINNQLAMTFSLTKSRYEDFISFPYHVRQVKEEGLRRGSMLLEDRGWPVVSMLSGQMDQIHEAKVFLKFFDHNYSARSIHGPILKDFKRRYSSDQKFTYVFRTTPSPKHWSFRGYAGAGHSNTKVVCLKQYIMDVLKEDRLLIQFPEEEWNKYTLRTKDSLPGVAYIKSRSYSLWGLALGREERTGAPEPGFSLPLYGDLGITCCQINRDRLLEKAKKELPSVTFDFGDSVPDSPPKTWQELFRMNKRFQSFKKRQLSNGSVYYHPPWIENLFAIPPLTLDLHCFLMFFLEILFDYAKLDSNSLRSKLSSLEGLPELLESRAFNETIELLRRMVLEGVSKSPLEKIHYHNSYFSRRWYSKVDQYPVDDPKIPDVEKYYVNRWHPEFDPKALKDRLEFSVAPLPTSDLKNNVKGISCLDFFSVGIIRGALAPETAFMFISELAASTTDVNRFEQRRGLPVLRDHWSCHQELIQRIGDRDTIDGILDKGRFFCNSWIRGYWHIESNANEWGRRIFIRADNATKLRSPYTVHTCFSVSIDTLRHELLGIVADAQKSVQC